MSSARIGRIDSVCGSVVIGEHDTIRGQRVRSLAPDHAESDSTDPMPLSTPAISRSAIVPNTFTTIDE